MYGWLALVCSCVEYLTVVGQLSEKAGEKEIEGDRKEKKIGTRERKRKQTVCSLDRIIVGGSGLTSSRITSTSSLTSDLIHRLAGRSFLAIPRFCSPRGLFLVAHAFFRLTLYAIFMYIQYISIYSTIILSKRLYYKQSIHYIQTECYIIILHLYISFIFNINENCYIFI